MKAFYILVFALFLTAACDGNFFKNNTSQEAEYESDAEWDMSDEDDDQDTMDENIITSASFLSKETAFNGIFALSPQQQATVTLAIDGIIKSITPLLPGEFVQKDELLAILENPELINIQQNYLEAHTQSEYLEAEYERQEMLAREDAVAQKRVQESRAELLSMKIRKDAAAAQLQLLGFSPQSIITNGMAAPVIEVRAPISGYISNLQINPGKHVAAGESLCEIIDKSSILVKLTVYERDLGRIKIGERIDFRVNGMGDARFRGEIISIGQFVDNVSRALDVYAKVTDDHPLFRPGMYVNARIVR